MGLRFVPVRSRVALVSIMLIAGAVGNAEQTAPRLADFQDVAEKAGLTMMNVFGGVDAKNYIIETTGTGVAIFDYDDDGWPDIFIVNGTVVKTLAPSAPPTKQL